MGIRRGFFGLVSYVLLAGGLIGGPCYGRGLCGGALQKLAAFPSRLYSLPSRLYSHWRSPPWQFSEEQEGRFRDFFSSRKENIGRRDEMSSHGDISEPLEALVSFTEMIFEERLSQEPPNVQQAVMRSFFQGKRGPMEPNRYNFRLNQIHNRESHPAMRAFVDLHEGAHSLDYNSGLPWPVLLVLKAINATSFTNKGDLVSDEILVAYLRIFFRYDVEYNSIGSQWEVFSRIPSDQRESMGQALREKFKASFRSEGSLVGCVMASLEAAHLSKSDFISALRPAHGYTIAQIAHYWLISFLLR